MAGSQSSPVLSPSRDEVMVPWLNMRKVDSKNTPSTNNFTALLPAVAILTVRSLLYFCLMNAILHPRFMAFLKRNEIIRADWVAGQLSKYGSSGSVCDQSTHLSLPNRS